MATYTNQAATKDNSLYLGSPTANYGSDAHFYCSSRFPTYLRHPIIEFNISDLPNGVEISTAKLYLRYFYFYGVAPYEDPVGRTIWAYKLYPDKVTPSEIWEELQSTWNIYKTGENWDTPGGDYKTSSPSGGSAVIPASYGEMEWNVKAIVEDAIANENDLVKLLLKDSNEGDAYMPAWRSRDYGTEAHRPKLVIEYTPPPIEIDTLAATSIQKTSATLNGEITDLSGGGNADERGFVYATQSYGDPGDTAPAASEYNDNGGYEVHEDDPNGGFSIGTYNLPVTGLVEATKYYVRAYAHNTLGYAYGDEVEFATLGWLSGWTKRVKMTIDTNQVGSALTWFPVLVHLSSACGIGNADLTCVFSEVGADSRKIAVTDYSGNQELTVEVQSWNYNAETPANSEAWIWVSKDGWPIPSSDNDTQFLYIYYNSIHSGNPNVSITPNSPLIAQAIWDGHYSLMSHMEDWGTIDRSVTSNIFKLVTSPYIHNSWGLGYPVTYKLSIPSALTNAKAYHRHKTTDSWVQLTGKESTDAQTPTTFYSGIECVRWDYVNDHAYVSVAFDSASDEIYVKITDASDVTQAITFVVAPIYYDNRKATVMWSADEFGASDRDSTDSLIGYCQAMSIWISIACYQWGAWSEARKATIQGYLDGGFVEIAQHTLDHQHDYDVTDFDEQIEKGTLLSYLDLPSTYKKGTEEYIWCFVGPFGDWDLATALRAIGAHKYLSQRRVLLDITSFAAWDSTYKKYARAGLYHYMEDGYDDNLATLKSEFDTVYAAGQVYSAMLHDFNVADWTTEGYVYQFMDYIKEKKDIWYVALGAAYLYRFVKQLVNGEAVIVDYVNQVLDSTLNLNDGLKESLGHPVEATGGIYKGQDFDGISDKISFGTDSSLAAGTSDLTVTALIKTNTSARRGIIDTCDASLNGYYFDVLSTGYLRAYLQSSSGNYKYKDSSVVVNDNDLHRVSFTWDYSAKTLKVFVDGVDVSTGGGGAGTVVSVPLTEFICGYSEASSGYFVGLIDEVSVSKTLRSDDWELASFKSGDDSLLTYGDEQELHLGAATLAGVGTLAAIGSYLRYGQATLSGIGTLAAIGVRVKTGAATLSGIGTLASIGVITAIGKATLAGVGTLSAALISVKAGAVTLAGVGTLVVIGNITAIGKATLSGVGTLASSGIITAIGKAVLSGIGTLTAIGRLITRGLSNYMEDAIINFMRGEAFPSPAQTYLALFTSESGLEENNPTSEVSGGAYARQALTLDAPSNGETENSADIWFPKATAGWGSIACAAIVDHATNSNWGVDVNVLMTLAVGDILTIESGDRFKLPAGDLDVAIV